MRIPFEQIDWKDAESEIVPGETGHLEIKRREFSGLLIRILKCSPNFKLDHWCSTGHIAYCIEGSCTLNLTDGSSFTLHEGSSFVVTDNQPAHDLISGEGATLFLIDGEFLADA